jgi:hypothetical protein
MKGLVVAMLALAVPAAAATAQRGGLRSRAEGFYIGANVEADGITTDRNGSETESGGGLGFVMGYGFNRHWSMYGQLDGATMNARGGGTYSLGHFDVGARVHFRSGPNIVVPFVQFGVSGRGISTRSNGTEYSGRGGGIALGGGLNAHFTPSVAMSTSVTWSFGSFDRFQVGNVATNFLSVDATSARVNVGLVWFP